MSATTVMDSVMPNYDVREYHETSAISSPQRAYEAIRSMNLTASPIILALMLIRGIPHILTGKASPSLRLTIDDLLHLGFVKLGDEPNAELVLGVVGKFWRPDSGIHPVSADEFASFDEPGFAKAILDFQVHDQPGSSVLISTETRIVATDEGARKRFLRYWRVIGPFSGFIRTRLLAAIKRSAEDQST